MSQRKLVFIEWTDTFKKCPEDSLYRGGNYPAEDVPKLLEKLRLIESLKRENESWRRTNDSWKRTGDLWRSYQRSMVSTVRRLARMLEDYADGVELTQEGRKQLDVFLLNVATQPLEGEPPQESPK